MDINALIQQAPNFLGFIVAIAYLWRSSTRQQTLLEKLIDVIVNRDNCDEEQTPHTKARD